MRTRTTRRLLLLALLALPASLSAVACDTALRHSAHSLSFPDPLLNAELGPRRVTRTDWDPFGWAATPVEARDDTDFAVAEARPAARPAAPVEVATAAPTPASSPRSASPEAAAPPADVPTSAAPPVRVEPAPTSANLAGPVELADAPPAAAYDPADSAAYVTAVYQVNGVDLRKAARGGARTPTIVELYRHAYKSGIVYQSEQPATGDLVFFHNTFDRNGDGRWNDWYTLVGVVEAVDPGGAVSALAYVDGQVTRIHVDPARADLPSDDAGAPVNSALRAGDDVPAPRAGYAGALFAGYANLLGDLSRVTVIDNWQPGMLTAQK